MLNENTITFGNQGSGYLSWKKLNTGNFTLTVLQNKRKTIIRRVEYKQIKDSNLMNVNLSR